MHASETAKHWMHNAHDGSIKAAHFTGHLLHEKSFWAILGILALIAGTFALLVFLGNNAPLQNYRVPLPYGPFY